MKLFAAAAALGVLATITIGASAASADKCTGTKIKAIGEKESRLLSARPRKRPSASRRWSRTATTMPCPNSNLRRQARTGRKSLIARLRIDCRRLPDQGAHGAARQRCDE